MGATFSRQGAESKSQRANAAGASLEGGYGKNVSDCVARDVPLV